MLLNSSKKPIITGGLHCPACDKYTRREWYQTTGLAHRPTVSQTDCKNPDCPSGGTTLEIGVFFSRYARPGARS